ncbi:hypothetical protein ANTQUA_LOCUS10083 [Anthophora quadrimaculata]
MQLFSIVIVPRIELRRLYIPTTVVVARCASDTCSGIQAFENQHCTTVAYLPWYSSRNTALQLFPVVIVLRTELWLYYLSRTVVVARRASDTCFRKEAFENQDSTTVAYSTWYCRRNTSIQVFSVVIVIRGGSVNTSDMCFQLEALENQNSTTVAYSTWDYRRSALILEFSVVIVLITELRLFYISRTVVVARCASDPCFRSEAFGKQHSTTVAYST